ncbi:MAG: sulfurtransferase [Fibrobacteria bacterium]|nr:sulfurtransferase [Fibrobacteria bacterium]
MLPSSDDSHTCLIDSATLRPNLERADWMVFDVRHDLASPRAGVDAWRSGHIPGALFLPLEEALSGARTGTNGRHPLPDRRILSAILAGLGLCKGYQVVVYDDQGGIFAARFWWLLRWLGHSRVAVLDGGFPSWLAEGGAQEDAPPAPRARGGFEEGPSLVSIADANQILSNLGNPSLLVVDARSPDRFRGENELLDPVGGHIPGAANRFCRDNLLPDGRFKPADLLRREFETLLDFRRPDQAVMQCGSGVTACHNLLAMEIAGLSGAALYPGSWSEWCSDPSRPVET